MPFIFGDCAQWSVPAAPASAAAPVTSDVPVLILSGALDAVTAPPNGQAVAAGLRNATTVEFPDAAHDVTFWSTACGVAVMRSFLSDPARVDRSCVDTLATIARLQLIVLRIDATGSPLGASVTPVSVARR